jgi:UDP-galactopyranose mutase
MPDAAGNYDVLVVGAGYAGSIMAERLATQAGLSSLVIDRRSHIAGNAYDAPDEHGTLIHHYGPHIFHTNSDKVVEYLSAFTEWMPYEHRVLASVDGQLLPIPINRTTMNSLYGLSMTTDAEAEAFLAERAEHRPRMDTSEDSCVARFGWDLYEKFFKGYTTKQWGMDPSQLGAQVCARIPVRFNEDDRYFTDTFQNMPRDGYTEMFKRILDHPLIEVSLNTEYADVNGEVEFSHLVWTGPIDEFFDHRLGKLPYRSLEFFTTTASTVDGGLIQPSTSINFPSADIPYTRITEFRHMTGQSPHPWSALQTEFPRAEGDPYYPIPRPQNRELYERYEQLGNAESDVTFVGRLARYQYLNMDQVVGQALATFERLVASGRLAPRAA